VSALTVKEEIVIIQTPTGPMHTLVLSPTAPGRYPAILLYSEIFQVPLLLLVLFTLV
jgi:carboxymethylenebutenolidase